VDAFKQWVRSKHLAHDYEIGLINKIPLLFGKDQKHTYDSEIIHTLILSKIELINSDKYCNRLVRLLLHYLEDEELISDNQIALVKKKLKGIKEGVDNHVPTDSEIQDTLSKLSVANRLVYLMYLVSGLRKVEGDYLVKNVSSLKCQQLDGFTKVTMNYLRHNKNSYFCYLPLSVYSKLTINYKKLSISSLENEIRRRKLIPIKYCRKWFYTKCIELGVPESIADYYQGRTANSVGSNHYLSRQMLADKFYSEKLATYLNRININI